MDWESELKNWLSPFLDRLQNVAQRRWMPLYVQGLLGPGERKSVEAMAERVAPGNARPLQNFLSAAPWRCSPLEELLAEEANRLVGGPDAVLVIDDTPLMKKGERSVGVAHQYCSQLGKTANCQVLVSTTLARGEVPICLGLRLYLPEEWTSDLVTLPRQTGPDVKFEHHLEEGHDEEDAEAVHGGVQSCGGCPAG
jgi:SRSO17 transposase